MFVRPQAKETSRKVAFFCLQGFFKYRMVLCQLYQGDIRSLEVMLGSVHPTTLPVFTGLMMLTDCFQQRF